MKNIIYSLSLAWAILLFSLDLAGQTFYTGFDTPEEQQQWTMYRISGDASDYNWFFNAAYSVSDPYSAMHDYPMGGSTVEDWLVSPPLIFTGDNSAITLFARIIEFSPPPEVYYGVWVSFGSADPGDGDYQELADLTLTPLPQEVFNDTVIPFPVQSDTGHVAIRYTANNFAWLTVWIDDLSVDSATLLPVTGIPGTSKESNVVLFPNPAGNELYIRTGSSGQAVAEIFNSRGSRVMKTDLGDPLTRIDLSSLPDGLYMVCIKNRHGVSCTRVVRQR